MNKRMRQAYGTQRHLPYARGVPLLPVRTTQDIEENRMTTLEKRSEQMIQALVAQKTVLGLAEAIAIAITLLKDKEGRYIGTGFSHDIVGNTQYCTQIAQRLAEPLGVGLNRVLENSIIVTRSGDKDGNEKKL